MAQSWFYARITLSISKEELRMKEKRTVDLCKALREWAEEKREEGKYEGIKFVALRMNEAGEKVQDIAYIVGAHVRPVKQWINMPEIREDGQEKIAKGLRDWAEEEREQGKLEGIRYMVLRMHEEGRKIQYIADMAGVSVEKSEEWINTLKESNIRLYQEEKRDIARWFIYWEVRNAGREDGLAEGLRKGRLEGLKFVAL